MSSINELILEALAVMMLNANVVNATDIGVYAIEYSLRNWGVLPLKGKVPAIPSRAGGRGVLDATTDPHSVLKWWSGPYAGCNIGGRVPTSMVVLDIDPRNGGLDSLDELQSKQGQLPPTLTTMSGRGDGGMHLFFRRPPGPLSRGRLGAGIDVKTSTGYVVLPPSKHPDTGGEYTRIERPVAATPHWLAEKLHPELRTTSRPFLRPVPSLGGGTSVADRYSNTASRADVLEPHGWRCLDADPDADGARWRHPTATSPSSASIKYERLFVYSPNTPFDVTEASNPRGYTRFRAFAVLNHNCDLRAAARAIGKAHGSI